MPWYQKAMALIGQPVGISLADGTGVSGILCSMSNGQVYVMEYLYRTQFATKHYAFDQIQDINPYPGCAMPRPYYPSSQRLY